MRSAIPVQNPTASDPQLEGDYNPAAATQDPVTGQQTTTSGDPWSPSDEQRARLHGWTPRAEFSGAPENWRTPTEFLAYMSDNPGVLVDRMGRLERLMVDQTERHVRDVAAAEAAAYERAKSELKGQIAQATDVGDSRAVLALTDKLADLPKPKPPPHPRTDDLPAFQDFQKRAPWYGKDHALTAFANGPLADQLRRAGYDDASPEYFAQIDKEVRTMYPHMFSNPRREQPGTTHAGNGAAAAGPKTGASLSAEARTIAERDVKRGLYKDVDAWAEVFFDQGDK